MGASKVNGGKNVEGSGYGRQKWQANKKWQQAKHSPPNKALQADTASGFSAWLRPQNKRPQMAGRAAKTTAADDVLPLAVQVSGGKCRGAGSHEGGLRPTYCPYPT